MNVNELIHAQLKKSGITLIASLPDDWVSPLIRQITTDPTIRHVPVGRESEAIAVCAGAFFGGVRSAAIMGATGLHSCTGELATIHLRHGIPVFVIVSARGSLDDHQVYQEMQGRRTMPLLGVYDYPSYVIDQLGDVTRIPDAYQHCRLQKRPCFLFLTKRFLTWREPA